MTMTYTLPGQIARLALERPERKALLEMGPDGGWVSTSWCEYWQAVRDLAKGLILLGVQSGDSVALIGNNRRDWVISQMGISAATGVPAPIYATNTVEQVSYIVKHCRARVAICDNQDQLQKYLTALERGLVELDHIIMMDEFESEHTIVTSLADVILRGGLEPDDELDQRMATVEPDDLALLVYTSGTTGVPKGTMCTHRGIDEIGRTFCDAFPEFLETDPTRYISYLPLCHVAEQAFTNFAGLHAASEIYFCPDLTKIKDYLLAARPHSFFGVPRV